MPFEVIDLGLLNYRLAWDRQLEYHAHVLEQPHHPGYLLLVEHPPVVTIGRHPDSARHLLVSAAMLAQRGVELVETDRGGDITFHGPGQIVAYPIVALNYYHLNLHAYMRLLEEVVIQTLQRYQVRGYRDPGATGVWVEPGASANETPQDSPPPPSANLAKVCAMGVKLRKWITLHGLALNVTTDLAYFQLINPCGLSRPVTSLQQLLPQKCPQMTEVKTTLAEFFQTQLTEKLSQRSKD